MLGALQAKQKLNLRSIGLLITSFTVLIVLGRAIVGEVGLVAVLNASWTPEALGAFLFALPLVGYATVGLGVAVFVYYGFRTHFQVDRFAVKKQFKKTFVIASLVFCGLFLSSLVTTPLVSAGTTATTGYYLATPYSPFDWLVGKYSTGSVYAINGSNWANLMTFPATTWAAYADNASKVQELVLAATTAGTVYLKEVAFDYDCTIPENVQVIENLNGLTRVFIDDGDSVGSPYTVSVDSVNPTYYTVQDSADRFIISWTSTNASSIIQSAINSMISKGGLIHIDSGNYTITNTIFLYSGITIEGSGNGVSTPTPNTVLTLANGANCDMFWFTNTTSHDFFETIRHITLIGNKAQQTADSNGIVVRGAVSDTTIDDVFFWEFRNASVYFEGEASGKQYYQFIQNSWIEGAGQYGIRMGTNSSLLAHHINIFNNHAITLNDVGIYMQYASYAQISLNTIKDNNKQGIYCQSSPYSHIENNFIFGNGVTPTNTNPDLEVNSANNVIVLGNSLGKTGYTSPKYALYLYWSDNVTVIGNDMWTGGTSIIGFSGSSGVVEKNARYNPVGYIINPFTGITLNLLNSGNNATMTSDWIYTNQFTTKTIYVSGGTVTAIKVNGQATGLTTGSFVLYPFDTFSITFSSAPTLKVMCQ